MNMGSKLKDDKGSVAVIIAVLLTVFMGIAALVIDTGSSYKERRQVQNAADSAALAGIQELPADQDSAKAVAYEYANRNDLAASDKNITVLSTNTANDTISVSLTNPDSPLYFARIWGKSGASISAKATAVVVSPTAYSYGVMPFGIMANDEAAVAGSAFGYEFGQPVTLKEPAGEGASGNYQIVALNEDSSTSGAGFIYDAVALGGVPNEVYKGKEYYTKTGLNGSKLMSNLAGWIGDDSHTFDDVRMNKAGVIEIEGHDIPTECSRLTVVPVIVNPEYPEGDPLRYNWSSVSGAKPVLVVDFAYFFIENVGTAGSDSYIRGRFVRVAGEDKAIAYGAITPTGALIFRLID